MHHLFNNIKIVWYNLTKWLDRNPVKVPVSKRAIAYVLDWAIGGVISGFPAVLIYSVVTGKSDIQDIFAINKQRLNNGKLTNEYLLAGDVNEDGKTNINDIFEINKYRLGIKTEL